MAVAHGVALESQCRFELAGTAKCVSGLLPACTRSRQTEWDAVAVSSRRMIAANLLCLHPVALLSAVSIRCCGGA